MVSTKVWVIAFLFIAYVLIPIKNQMVPNASAT